MGHPHLHLHLHLLARRAPACLLALASVHASAQAVAAAPPFDAAYRAWDVVSGIARHERDPALRGVCGQTFQVAAVPALRRQTKAQQDAAAAACHQQARALCASRAAARTAAIAGKCEEFR